MKKKMLYVMHIDWNWIKQRPQFLAEELSSYYDVTVVYTYGYRRELINKNDKENLLKLVPLYRLPIAKIRNTLFGEWLNALILKLQFSLLGKNYDYVWLTSPTYVDVIKNMFEDSKIIYDCMDDNIGISDEIDRIKTIKLEEKLLDMVDDVFISSSNLDKVLRARGYKNKTYLLNNGISSNLVKIAMSDNLKTPTNTNDNILQLLYIGTIAYWFDFEKILKLLNDFSNITITLVGPCEVDIPKHEKLIYKGILAHKDLQNFAKNFDILIMPFVLNELILSVNPVKIYEYISFNKNIITVYYKEMDKFVDFVHFYNSYEELRVNVEFLIKNRDVKYSKETAIKFLEENTWTVRAKTVFEILEKN